MKIKSIAYAGVEDVYNMEVEGTHDFAVGCGVIAHNCYDELRYVCMKNPIAARKNIPPKLIVYDPLSTEDSKAPDRYQWFAKY